MVRYALFYKNLNVYGIITFNKSDYVKIINKIKQSRGYISYIDSKADIGKVNNRYEKYINLKQAAYTSRPPRKNTNEDVTSFYTMITPESVDMTDVERFLNEYGVKDDYEYEYEITYKDDNSYIAHHKIIPIEYISFDKALELDNNFEVINRSYLRDDFVLKNHQRFNLPPFLAKYKGKYVQPIIIANIYDVGIITLQVTFSFEEEKIDNLSEESPTNIIFPCVEFNEKQATYRSKDFEKKNIQYNVTVQGILNYYYEYIQSIIGDVDIQLKKETQYAWVFGDYEINKDAIHSTFIEKNKSYYAAHLINASSTQINRYNKKRIDKILTDSIISDMKTVHYYCSESISVLSFSYSAFHKEAVDTLKEEEKDLKKEKIYEHSLKELYKYYSLTDMFEFLRIQELTFIKKYFAVTIFEKISQQEIKTLDEYNVIRMELNKLRVNYDEQILFKSAGSAKNLYCDILEKTKTNEILNKVEKLFSATRDDVNSFREKRIDKVETLIFTLTSVLTVLLGYQGIKLIVYDILLNLPWKMNYIFISHPLRWTISLWLILLGIMGVLNFNRSRASKL